MEISGHLIPLSDGTYRIEAICTGDPMSIHDRASMHIENDDLFELKRLDSIAKINFSEFDWELAYQSVDRPKILRYICERRDFIESEGWHILVKAVRKKNIESLKYLINECHMDPWQLKSIAFVNDKYTKLALEGDLPCIN